MTSMPDPTAFSTTSATAIAPFPAVPRAVEEAPLRRPRLLIRAARAGQGAWRRDRDLPRLLGNATLPGAATVMRLLRAEEAWLDRARREGHGAYSLERHVAVLIALLAEIRAEVAPGPRPSAEIIPFSGRGTARPERP